jgi:hypothetical protein
MTCRDLEGYSVGKQDYGQMLIPICLMLIDQFSKQMANNLIGGFCLPVALKILSCRSAML